MNQQKTIIHVDIDIQTTLKIKFINNSDNGDYKEEEYETKVSYCTHKLGQGICTFRATCFQKQQTDPIEIGLCEAF